MAKTKISEFSATPANNTDIDSINIAEGCAPSGINDAIRELMAQLKDFQTGAVGDSFNGPIGSTSAVTGAFTTLSATGAITSTLATGSAPFVIASTTKVANLNVDLLDGADWAAPAALGSTTPAAVSATTLTTSSTVTLNGGTANGVAYLNGSKVVTSGSALTFDGTTFVAKSNIEIGNSLVDANRYVNIIGAGANKDFGIQFGGSRVLWQNTGQSGLLFGVSDAEQMRLTSTGLGIGTSSPASKLDVLSASNNIAQFSGAANGYVDFTNGTITGRIQTSGSVRFGSTTNHDVAFLQNNTEGMRLTSTGLGIGTSSPSGKLTVANTYTNTSDATIVASSSIPGINLRTASTGRFSLFTSYSSNNSTSFLGGTGTNNPSTEIIKLDHSNGNVLIPSGNLGINTASPAAEIDIGGNPTYEDRLIWSRGVTDSAFKAVLTSGNTGAQATIGSVGITYAGYKDFASIQFYRNSTVGNLLFFTGGLSGDGTQKMILNGDGNLGIGTSSPSTKLHVKDTRATLRLEPTAVGGTTFDIRNGVSGGSEGGLSFYDITNSATRAVIDSSGNLLLGTTSNAPAGTQAQLVNKWSGGSKWGASFDQTVSSATQYTHINFSTNGTTVGYINANNSITTYNSVSDYRLKTVIGAVSGSGERIDALEPIEYEWKVDGSRTRGFLAHKFQEVYAGSVSGDKDAVDAEGNPVYQAMQAGSAEVIADLVAEIQSLRKRLADAGI